MAWGGSEELWYLGAQEAQARGHSVLVSVFRWPTDAPKVQALEKKGAVIHRRRATPPLIHRLVSKLSARLGLKPPSFLNPFLALEKWRPDLVVVTDGATYYTVEDPWLSSTLSSYFKGRYLIICQGNAPYHMPSDRRRAREFFAQAARVLFVSEGNRRQAYHQLASRIENSEVVQNPIQDSVRNMLPMPEYDGGLIRFATVGRLAVSDKGQDLLLSALSDPYWKAFPYRLHIYGSGSDRAYLEELIAYYGLSEKVALEGYADPSHIWAKCHCLVMPSIIEGTPLTLLEAMSAGRVCIATDVGGNSQWIEDGFNGYLIDAPKPELIDRKMRQAVSEFDGWSRMAKEARRTIEERAVYDQGSAILSYL